MHGILGLPAEVGNRWPYAKLMIRDRNPRFRVDCLREKNNAQQTMKKENWHFVLSELLQHVKVLHPASAAAYPHSRIPTLTQIRL